MPSHVKENVEIYHDREALYRKLRERGMEYGDLFQVTQEIWKRGQETLSRLVIPEDLQSEMEKFQLHPAIIDACIQMLGATIPEELVASGTGETYLPTGVTRYRQFAKPVAEMWVHAELKTDFASEGLRLAQGDIHLLDCSGQVIAEYLGVTLTRIGTRKQVDDKKSSATWVHALEWIENPLAEFWATIGA
jgi:myxalamid-type polyketide synthase MxaE and MxaD